MGRIFLSYRREDSLDVTGRVFDRLASQFGAQSVFMDVDTIPFGVDFRAHFSDWIQSSDIVLVIIGDGWLEARYSDGPMRNARRLDDTADFVRIEVSSALARGIPVVPVLVGSADMPGAADLPEELQGLAYRNAAEVRSGRDFHGHMDRLIRGLEQLLDQAGPAPARPVAATPAAHGDITLAALLARRVALSEPIALHILAQLVDLVLDGRLPVLDPRAVVLGPATSEPQLLIADPSGAAVPGDYGAPEETTSPGDQVFGIGQILWELLTGRAAFTGNRERIRIEKRRQNFPLALRQTPFAVSSGTEDFVSHCTTHSPSSRATVEQAAQKIRELRMRTTFTEVITPVNLGFEGDVSAGLPHGWSDGLVLVAGVSARYDIRVEPRDTGACVCVQRRGAHPNEFGTVMQRVPGPHLSSRTVRLSGSVRTDDVQLAGLWLRADGHPTPLSNGDLLNNMLFFDNMRDRPIAGTTPWTHYTIETALPAGVAWLNYGLLLEGDGTAWVDDLDFSVQTADGNWQPLAWERLVGE